MATASLQLPADVESLSAEDVLRFCLETFPGRVALAVGPANVIFEAPSKAAQSWFIKNFGPSVNLGNIPPEEVIPLETLRLGLRGDTMKEVLLGDDAATPA